MLRRIIYYNHFVFITLKAVQLSFNVTGSIHSQSLQVLYFLSVQVLLFPFTASLSRCSSKNSRDENMDILLGNTSGVIQSPGYPSSYPAKLIMQCRWKIVAPRGKMVRMTFTSFQLNMDDWVEFTDNTDNWNPYFITRSGSVPSFTVYSTGRGQLGVKVKAHTGRTGPGFIATYTMVPAAGQVKYPGYTT